MAIRQVLKMGDPRLLWVSEPVQDFKSQALKDLIEDMQDTDRKSTRLNSSHMSESRMPSSA